MPTKHRIGAKVQVMPFSGLDSGKTGVIVSPSAVKTAGDGIPLNIPGAYQQVNWRREVAVQLDNGGGLITMFKSHLNIIDQRVKYVS